MTLPILSPTDFVALVNQTLEFAYPNIDIEGEIKNFKISRGRWVYFDIADDTAKIRCFGTVYLLPGPIEDGMKVRITASPRMHPQFGFSLNLMNLQLSGEGTIKKAANLLQAKLEAEGLFALERKRTLPYPPERIGLITSEESAAYRDFIKVLSARFGGMSIELGNVQVQGDPAIGQIVRAIEWFNRQAETVDVLIVVRGGGSADDLQAFSSEQVTRAVAASRIPTLVAIGHEVDISLAELAADVRASTPSNAAELLVPDRREMINQLSKQHKQLHSNALALVSSERDRVNVIIKSMTDSLLGSVADQIRSVSLAERTLQVLSPDAVLRRGYAIIRKSGKVIKNVTQISPRQKIDIQFADGQIEAEVQPR